MTGADRSFELAVDVERDRPVRLRAQLRCGAGELLALVGPSGSGKSSLLRCIAGLARGTRGRVAAGGETWLDSERGIDLPPQRRRVGMVFQHYALFPHLSALRNVALVLESRGVGAAQAGAQARELLARVQLDGLRDRLPAALSGGQQQRVAIARALAREPAALLLDEPFSAVDQVVRQSLYEQLAELRRALSVPIVLVTHDLAEARLLADRMTIIDGGETLQSGTPTAVLSGPRNARIAELVGIQNHFPAIFRRAEAPGAQGELVWGDADGGIRLACVDKGRLRDSTPVTWVIAGEYLSLRPAGPDAPNAIRGRLERALSLGEITRCRVRVDRIPEAVVAVRVRSRDLATQSLAEGSPVQVLIDPAGIHVMPLHGHGQRYQGSVRRSETTVPPPSAS